MLHSQPWRLRSSYRGLITKLFHGSTFTWWGAEKLGLRLERQMDCCLTSCVALARDPYAVIPAPSTELQIDPGANSEIAQWLTALAVKFLHLRLIHVILGAPAIAADKRRS